MEVRKWRLENGARGGFDIFLPPFSYLNSVRRYDAYFAEAD